MRQPKEQKAQKKAYVKRMKRIRFFFWFVFVCLLLAGTGTLLAKYYAKESRKGVATASGLYFTSNYLESVSGNDLPERLNSNHWDGQDECNIEIEIRNYSNFLLYNDANLNITYDLYFQMVGTPNDGELYTVYYYKDGEETKTSIDLSDGEVHKITDLYLPGGQATANKVILTIDPGTDEKVANTYRSQKVKVWAYPTAPNYVADSFELGAIISASPSKEVFTCEGAFDVSEKMTGKSWAECAEIINAYSGFVYRVQTNGELDENFDGKSMVLTWNHQYLDIDMYNEYYQKALGNSTYTKNGDYSTITMELVSYSSMEFNFYKTANFTTDSWTAITDFEGLVELEIK